MRELRAVRRGCGQRVVGWVVGVATALGMGTPALAQVAPAPAQAPLPAFGMIGLAEGQFAILKLVLVGPPEENHPGCRLTTSFVNEIGDVLVTRTVRLQPQIARGLRLPAASILADHPRPSIRAVLSPVPNDTAPSDCRCLIANQAVEDADGRTSVLDYGRYLLPPGIYGNPAPPPPSVMAACQKPPDSRTTPDP